MEISTMKVKVRCCRSCQRKAKKILDRADGVQATCIDISEGLPTVTGDVEPFLLIEMVEKEVKKRVDLWSYRRYPAYGCTEHGGGSNDGRHDTTKEADLRGAIDRKKAARRRPDRERAGHADPAPAGLRWPGPRGCHPKAGPCQHQGDLGQRPFWNPHGPPPPPCCWPPEFLPPYNWYYPMSPPPTQPPQPYYYPHEVQRPKE